MKDNTTQGVGIIENHMATSTFLICQGLEWTPSQDEKYGWQKLDLIDINTLGRETTKMSSHSRNGQ